MSANLETNITIKGKTNDLKSMLKYLANNEYFEEDSDLQKFKELSENELEDYIAKEGNEINLFIMGPYGKFKELQDTKIFEGLANSAPDASFEGEMSKIYGPTEYSLLTGKFNNKKLELEHIMTYNMIDSYVKYLKSKISTKKFCKLFHIDEEEFDLYDYRDFFENEYLKEVSLDEFQEYFDYAEISEEEFEIAIKELTNLNIEDSTSYIERKSKEEAKTWIYEVV